jgi:gamma-glutamyltranspeptidase / glutathione hydrolase
LDGGGKLLASLPSLGATLSKLAKDGPESFYTAEIPETIVRFLQRLGGVLSEGDFENYVPRVRSPVNGELRGLKVLSMPPPSAGGALLIRGLAVLEELQSDQDTHARRLDLLARTLEHVLAEKANFGDPDFLRVDTGQMLSDKSIKGLVDRVSTATDRGSEEGSGPSPGSTSHFCVSDKDGNVVSATETIECYFGSGVAVPGAGVVMNDEMHDFDPTPGRPNSVAPGKRPASSMSPTILLKDGSPYMALGGAGSERITSSIFQVLTNVLDGKMDLASALAAPRLHPVGGALRLEGGFDDALIAALSRASWKVQQTSGTDMFFGGVQAIMIDQESRTAKGCADPRRLGSAVSVE